MSKKKTKRPEDKSYADALFEAGERAFIAARKKAAEALKAKAEARAAMQKARNLRTMINALNAPPIGADGSVGYRRSKHRVRHDEWPWRAALASRGMTPSDYARQQRTPPLGIQTAKSWLKAGAKNKRPIPEFWALRIQDDFRDAKGKTEVPAVDSSWPHGITRT